MISAQEAREDSKKGRGEGFKRYLIDIDESIREQSKIGQVTLTHYIYKPYAKEIVQHMLRLGYLMTLIDSKEVKHDLYKIYWGEQE